MSYKSFDFLVVGGGYSGLSVTTELIDKGFNVENLIEFPGH